MKYFWFIIFIIVILPIQSCKENIVDVTDYKFPFKFILSQYQFPDSTIDIALFYSTTAVCGFDSIRYLQNIVALCSSPKSGKYFENIDNLSLNNCL